MLVHCAVLCVASCQSVLSSLKPLPGAPASGPDLVTSLEAERGMILSTRLAEDLDYGIGDEVPVRIGSGKVTSSTCSTKLAEVSACAMSVAKTVTSVIAEP